MLGPCKKKCTHKRILQSFLSAAAENRRPHHVSNRQQKVRPLRQVDEVERLAVHAGTEPALRQEADEHPCHVVGCDQPAEVHEVGTGGRSRELQAYGRPLFVNIVK